MDDYLLELEEPARSTLQHIVDLVKLIVPEAEEGRSYGMPALRYNKKDATLLAYLNEPHGLRGLANRRDLTVRYFQFMDHYFKGTPAPKWLTDGVPFLVKDAGSVGSP